MPQVIPIVTAMAWGVPVSGAMFGAAVSAAAIAVGKIVMVNIVLGAAEFTDDEGTRWVADDTREA